MSLRPDVTGVGLSGIGNAGLHVFGFMGVWVSHADTGVTPTPAKTVGGGGAKYTHYIAPKAPRRPDVGIQIEGIENEESQILSILAVIAIGEYYDE